MAREEDEIEDVGAGGDSPSPQPSPRRGEGVKPCRPRHDGFTPARRRIFFKALKKSGCIADAARACGISRNTVRRWRGRWPAFDERVEAALAIAAAELDLIAWRRATVGTEEKVYRDGRLVQVRLKPSDSILRLLMQGANPKKYGRMGQLPRKVVMKRLRKEVEAEIRATLTASEAEVDAAILKQLDVLDRRLRAKDAGGELPPPDDGQA